MITEQRILIGIFATLFSLTAFSTQVEIRSRDGDPKAPDYNFKVGNLALDLRYQLGIVYDDNTNRSSPGGQQEDGTKIGNALTMNMDWPLNPHLHLQSGIRLGYVFIVAGEGTDGLIVSGTDGEVAGDISFDVNVGQAGILTIQEKLSRELDTVEIDRVDNQTDFSLWHNTLALQYQHQLTSLMYGVASAAWKETWSDKEKFEFRDNSAYIIDAVLLTQVNTLVQAGPYVRYVESDFHNRDSAGFRHHDTSDFQIGLNVRYRMSAATTAILSLGFQELFVDEDAADTPAGAPVFTDEDDGIIVHFRLYNELSDFVKHNLLVSYGRNPGTSTNINFSEDILTTYNIGWEFTQDWELLGQFTWLKTNESGDGELADLFITLAGLRYNISPKSDLSLDYRRSEKFSDLPGRDYERDEFRLLFAYDF